jgi:DNA-binding transcriptional LysR family regulator
MRPKRPSAHALYAFEAAARHGNFTRAAQELQVTQPAISRAIAGFEEELGEQLFVRAGPKIQLTSRGAELSAVLTEAFGSVEQLIASWEERKNSRVPILLSISSSMASHWLIPRLSEFRQAFSDVDLRFELIQGGVGVSDVDADLGLRRFSNGRRIKDGSFYLEEIIQPLASLDYINRMGTLKRPRSKRPHTLITLSNHWCDWATFARMADFSLPEGTKLLSFSDYSVALESALNGQGIVLGWLSVSSRLLATRALFAASSAYIDTGATFNFIAYKDRNPTSEIARVQNWMRSEVSADIEKIRNAPKVRAKDRSIALPKV